MHTNMHTQPERPIMRPRSPLTHIADLRFPPWRQAFEAETSFDLPDGFGEVQKGDILIWLRSRRQSVLAMIRRPFVRVPRTAFGRLSESLSGFVHLAGDLSYQAQRNGWTPFRELSHFLDAPRVRAARAESPILLVRPLTSRITRTVEAKDDAMAIETLLTEVSAPDQAPADPGRAS